MPFPEPQITEVDGVPVWFTDVPGPCMGGITFRTGRADERLTIAGINHMVEHLALHPFEPQRYDLNGTVTELTTRFLANGPQEDVEAVLTNVCRHLGALPVDRLEQERQILDNESRRRGGSFAGLASARFGARGAGCVDFAEHTRGFTPEIISAWATEHFSVGQAAVWMTRPPSDGLRLPLTPGDRLPIPAVEPLPGLVTPSHAVQPPFTDYLGCSLLARRSIELYVATQLFLARGYARLRGDLGLAYTVAADSTRVSANDSLYVLVCDAPSGEWASGVSAFCEVLDDLCGGDLGDDEVRDAFERAMPWNSTDPARTVKEVSRKADSFLLGHEPTSWADLEAQGKALTPATVGEAFAAAMGSAILAVPFGMEPPNRYRSVAHKPMFRHRLGRTYFRWDANPSDLVTVNEHGITRELGSTTISAEFVDVEALVLGQDGTITLVRRDAWTVPIQPNQLLRGRELAERLQERLADRVIDLRGDAIAWFEMQLVLETHDRDLIRSVWRELEVLAEERRLHERVLAVAVADLGGHRGVVAVTDSRVLHIAIDRPDVTRSTERSDITGAETSIGIRGGRLRLTLPSGTATLDRIRPRGYAAELATLLTPIQDPDGSG